ncbi:hypothetical protein PTTG_00206 [Puccinia triticina 1-1 BBBD Race 1]|uniref:Uncharacterized protein n=1 Tax=Puccinia triticina (isolate 1-1 / race 1 (BBBD)) TaxID=630390 RepID=A0A180GZS6_PUCT1|nr:hypothetical protein PTTG_00206 [Puccinia triticina 1-1 BBBD Race 1]WAR59145.1 hypothetical protein PtB15_10B487 [Puccinia triticina]
MAVLSTVQPRRRHESLKGRLKEADLRINGSISDRLQLDRDRLLEEENAHKDRMDTIGGFRKTEIIPIGKLQRAIDESDTESEPLSESEDTASAQQALQAQGAAAGVDEASQQYDGSQDWPNNNTSNGQEDQHSDGLMPAEDLDADLEDLDNDELDYSHATTNPDLSSRLGQLDQSYQSFESEN